MPRKPVKKAGDPLIGALVERRWQILDHLGAGGMGVVYRAERAGLGKQVAVKFLHQSVAESKAAVARFEREAKAISRLHHMHCVSILDFGVWRKQPYIVMEFVQGRQLTEVDMAAVTPKRAVAFLRQILLGLGHAHSRGVIHRDLKLSNVMLVEMTGTEDLVKILDFGLARISGVDEELSLTDGMVAGTPSYMSPEQARGGKTDLRTDIYSAGVMLYVLATGKRPFVADGPTQLLQMQIHDAPTPPRMMAPQKRISDGLERVILRALEKRPQDRFQSVAEFVAAIDDTPEGQETLTPTVMRQRQPRRWRWRLMGIAAALCVALGAAGALWARAYFIEMRAKAVGAYQRWSRSEPAVPSGGELPDPPKTAATAAKPVVPAAAPKPQPTPPPPTAESVAPKPEATPPKVEEATAPKLEEPATPQADDKTTLKADDKTTPQADDKSTPQADDKSPPKAEEKAPKRESPPPSKDAREWRQRIDGLLADGKVNLAKNELRDRIAVAKDDAWSHLRLGDVYADGFHYRRDAFREWTSALALGPALASDGAFRKSVCETVDGSDPAPAAEFLRAHFDADESAALLAACVRAATDPARVENAARLVETVAGADRPELGMAALRMLDVGKSCAQKKAAVATIRRLHYLRARAALVKLDRQRLAHQSHPPPALACFGTSIADAIEQLK
jgi:tRNA A-37 threonylcarbamoyl transferase component Bud32